MRKHWHFLLILVLLILPTLLPFFNSKFFYTQDYIFIARLNQLSTALGDGHFPPRWAPDLRYGEPIFNYYAAFPYYIGAFIHLLGINFIWVAKILFVLSVILSALTMYFLVSKMFDKKAGFLAALLYTYAPYRAVDLYVRGALSEAWAFVFFPLIFLSSYNLAKKINPLNICFLGICLAGLFLTHNVTTLMFLPFLFLWWAFLIFKEKQFKKSPFGFLLSFLLGIGLAAFFLLPASFERDFIQTKYLIVGYFNFRAHFVALGQFFSTFWGYGSSLWGLDDGLSFQVGIINWVVIALGAILSFKFIKDKKLLALMVALGVSFLLSIFLQHNKSAFIWEKIPLMAFIQFPWRFLGISIFITSIIGGVVGFYLKGKLLPLYFILITATIFSTLGYFKPKEYVEDQFFEKFLDKQQMHKGIDLTKDYLPIWVKDIDGIPLNYPEAENGKVEISNFEKKAGFASAKINVIEDSTILIPITYFPGWTVFANNQNMPLEDPDNRGLIRFKLNKGSYDVHFQFKDTLVRMIGNFISLFSLLAVLALVVRFRKSL